MVMYLKVLIIEDREDDAILLVHCLKQCGFDPKWQRVDSEAELATAVEDRRWDLVLCDLSMPALSPFMALDCVRRVNPDIPIIIVTGAVNEENAAKLIQHGVQDVVLKQDLPRLKSVIRREQHLAQNRREKVAAELRLAMAIENLSQGVAVFDSETRLIVCNRRYELSLDLCKDIIVPGAQYSDIVRSALERGQYSLPKDPASPVVERVTHFLSSTDKDPFELRRHDGRWLRVERHRTEEGGVVTVLTDVTEDKRREETLIRQAAELATINTNLIQEIRNREAAQQALQESESRAQAIFESAVDGVITFNEDRLIETVNPAAQSIFGYDAEELQGTHIHHLMLLGGGGAAASGQHAAPAEGEIALSDARLRLVTGWRKNGESFPVELTISRVELRDRVIYTGIIRDVTERAKLERMQREFVSVVSHELRTPLTAIQGSLALLDNGVVGQLSPRAKSMASIGLQNSNRLLHLIDDILDMEKIESGRMDFNFAPLSVNELIEEAAEANRAFVDRYNASVNTIPLQDADIIVNGDYGRLLQVLANLFSNAAKYSPAGGLVTIGARLEGETVRIWVSDEGPGIAPEFRSRIFHKFSQVDSSDSRHKGGTGLGLSIAKAIVEQHGGTIDFDTAQGGGTTFYFILPVAEVKLLPQVHRQSA
jgi:PAS domain S-box-containing protein